MSEELIRENATLKAEAARRRHQVKTLNAQIEQLNAQHAQEIATIRAEHEAAVTHLNESYEELMTESEAVLAERNDFEAKLQAAPDEYGKKTLELEGKLLARDHRDLFKEHIYGKPLDEKGELRIRDDVPVEDLWRTMNYEPKPGDFDALGLRQQVLALRENGKGYLFATGQPPVNGAPGGAKPASKIPDLPPGPGASRGSAAQVAPGSYVVSRAQMRDPKFTLRNQPAIEQATREGKLVITND